jgi:hypothetical protein
VEARRDDGNRSEHDQRNRDIEGLLGRNSEEPNTDDRPRDPPTDDPPDTGQLDVTTFAPCHRDRQRECDQQLWDGCQGRVDERENRHRHHRETHTHHTLDRCSDEGHDQSGDQCSG